MKNTEIANSKNKRIQKALQRQLYGAHGIETVKKMNISNLNDEKARFHMNFFFVNFSSTHLKTGKRDFWNGNLIECTVKLKRMHF